MNTYQKYLNISNLEIKDQLNLIGEIVMEHPKLMNYLINKADTCYGPHIVYVIKLEINGIDVIKVGYTKNTIEERFKEVRWKGVKTIKVKEIYRQEKFQALGAKKFEGLLNEKCIKYRLGNNYELPGKKEFLKLESLDDVLKLYDEIYPPFKDVVGLKSPN